MLVKNAESLQAFEKVDTLVIDKTGTLTEGKPKLIAVEAVGGSNHDLIARRSEELVALGAPREDSARDARAGEATDVEATATQPGPKPARSPAKEAPAVAAKAAGPVIPQTAQIEVKAASAAPARPAPADEVKLAAMPADGASAGTGRSEAGPAAAASSPAKPAVAAVPMPVAPGAKSALPLVPAAKTVGADASIKAAKEARIFVVPHAPDDPGPDDATETETPAKGTRPPYRAVP